MMKLIDILQARDERVKRQNELLQQFGKPLICFTMNIAGPKKNSPLITQGFRIGERLLRAQFPTSLHSESRVAETGCEGFYVVDMTAERAKQICMEIENSLPLGRLFDMDVLDENGRKMERGTPRRCLLCDNDARICARSRVHGLEALQERTTVILTEAVQRARAEQIGTVATKALLFEVCTTPKPGLVDCVNSGSHEDMDLFTFLSSASALMPYFIRCAGIGMEEGDILPKLRFEGKNAEAAMYQATGGVNTHKGAIFSLGLLCAAAGRAGKDAGEISKTCAALCKGITQSDFAGVSAENARTVGERLYVHYGITGVRGQAEAGFPEVVEVGLPKLREGLARGLTLQQAGAATLLSLLCVCEDTNMIARGGVETYRQTVAELRELLDQEPYPSEQCIRQLDTAFLQQNLSPGGTADLLALTYFLHFLQTDC